MALSPRSDSDQARATITARVAVSTGYNPATTMDMHAEAIVKCPKCSGWSGVVCPHGCGVHLEVRDA